MGCERTDLVGCTVKDIKQINEDKIKDDERQLFVSVVFFCDHNYDILKITIQNRQYHKESTTSWYPYYNIKGRAS